MKRPSFFLADDAGDALIRMMFAIDFVNVTCAACARGTGETAAIFERDHDVVAYALCARCSRSKGQGRKRGLQESQRPDVDARVEKRIESGRFVWLEPLPPGSSAEVSA
jgi:hypothetical protein